MTSCAGAGWCCINAACQFSVVRDAAAAWRLGAWCVCGVVCVRMCTILILGAWRACRGHWLTHARHHAVPNAGSMQCPLVLHWCCTPLLTPLEHTEHRTRAAVDQHLHGVTSHARVWRHVVLDELGQSGCMRVSMCLSMKPLHWEMTCRFETIDGQCIPRGNETSSWSAILSVYRLTSEIINP